MSDIVEGERVLEVVGTEKKQDDILFEEVWMRRIELLEQQYDQHVTKIQQRLFDEKFDKRVLESLKSKNARLVDRVKELSLQSKGLERNVEKLDFDLNRKKAKESNLKKELEDTRSEVKDKKHKLKIAEVEAKAAIRQKELIQKQDSILRIEEEKLITALKDRENEISELRHEAQTIGKGSQALVEALKKAQADKIRATKEAEAAEASVAFLIRQHENDEERILRMKKELDEIIKQLHVEKEQLSEKERQQMLHEKNLQAMREELTSVLSKVTSSALETRYWKQEAETLLKIAEAPPSIPIPRKVKLQVKQKERCREADLIHRIGILERRLKTMEDDKAALTNQMKTLTSLHKSLMRIHRQNLLKRKLFEERTGFRRPCKQRQEFQLQGSKTDLEKNAKKIQTLEKEIIGSKRAYNYLKFKLQEKPELENKLRQAEKTLFQVEREKRDLDMVAHLAAKKFGEAPSSDWTSLKEGFTEQIRTIQALRERLPPLVPPRRARSEYDVRMNTENVNEKLSSLRKELTALERKRVVFENIKLEKERLAEEQRLREAEEKERKEEEFVIEDDSSEIPDSLSSESGSSLKFSDEGDEDGGGPKIGKSTKPTTTSASAIQMSELEAAVWKTFD